MPLFFVYQKVERIDYEHVLVRGIYFGKKHQKRKADEYKVSFNRRLEHLIPDEQYIRIRSLADSVFKARIYSGDRCRSKDATAFLVGPNLVLTNNHAIYPEEFNGGCAQFSVKPGGAKKKSLRCSRELYCNREYDFCLVEVDGLSEKYPEIAPLTLTDKSLDKDNLEKMLAIGNARGLGIQAGAGAGYFQREFTNSTEPVVHYAPLFQGSSGGPLINEQDQVVGINYAQSEQLVGKEAFNLAMPISKVLQLLKDNVSSTIYSSLNI